MRARRNLDGQPWTADEDDAIRRHYAMGADVVQLALPHRTVKSIYHRARTLKVEAAHRWTAEQDEKLRWYWEEGQSLDRIGRHLGKRRESVFCRARTIGLPIGVPPGWEYFSAACKRTGFYQPTLRRILAFAGVRMRLSLSEPYARGEKYPQRIVEPEVVDEAVKQWLETEDVSAAARARDMEPTTLRTWLRDAGVLGPSVPGNRRHARVLTEVIDRVIRERPPKATLLLKAALRGAAARWGKAA